jgi:hypothetical protein
VVRTYLNDALRPRGGREKQWIYISEVKVRSAAGEQCQFESGETAWVDIEVRARDTTPKLSVVIWLEDESRYELFNTSTERLGHQPFSLKSREGYRCTFELTLNLAHGTFRVCAAVHRSDVDHTYDRWVPGSTLFIGSTTAVRGAVNCFPRLVCSEMLPATPRTDLADMAFQEAQPAPKST